MEGDLAKMQGRWRFMSLELEGKQVPPEHLDKSNISVEGDTFITSTPDATYRGTISLNTKVTPKEIDIQFTDGPNAGKTSCGIYEFDGMDWRMCLGLAGAPRPTNFATSPGSGHALEELELIID